MAVKRTGLGKGLDSLIPAGTSPERKNGKEIYIVEEKREKAGETIVDINRVEPNREQPRTVFDEASLKELSDSIKQFGVIQPLLVHDKGKYLEIIAGERRWRAAKMAGLKEVPVIIRDYSDIERMQVALIENIQRQDLNPIEEALAYKKLIDEFDLKQDEVADRVSKSRTAVTNTMRLLKLNKEVQQMVIDGDLSTGHARALLAISGSKEQLAVAKYIIDKNLNVRQTEEFIRNRNKTATKKKKPVKNAIYSDMENQLREKIGTKVTVSEKSSGKGKVEIEYYSQDDLERIYNMMMSYKGR